MKLAITLLMLSSLAFGQTATKQAVPDKTVHGNPSSVGGGTESLNDLGTKLSDHDKYEARTIQIQAMQAQITLQDADKSLKAAQAQFQTLSDKACGKDAMLDLGKTQGAEPSCVPKPTEAAKK